MQQTRIPAIVNPSRIPVRPVAVAARQVPPPLALAHPLLKVQQLGKPDIRRLVEDGVANALPLEAVPVDIEIVLAVFVEAVLVGFAAAVSVQQSVGIGERVAYRGSGGSGRCCSCVWLWPPLPWAWCRPGSRRKQRRSSRHRSQSRPR